MPIMVKSFLCLSHHSHNHHTGWNNIRNQIDQGGCGNDNIGEGVSAINK